MLIVVILTSYFTICCCSCCWGWLFWCNWIGCASILLCIWNWRSGGKAWWIGRPVLEVATGKTEASDTVGSITCGPVVGNRDTSSRLRFSSFQLSLPLSYVRSVGVLWEKQFWNLLEANLTLREQTLKKTFWCRLLSLESRVCFSLSQTRRPP